MPIKPENRHKYPPHWKALSHYIRHVRAGNQCERCGAPNGKIVARDPNGQYMLEDGQTFDAETGEFKGYSRGSEFDTVKMLRVVLTVAHFDHNPENCDESNLKAWCQRCHLKHDKQIHAEHAKETRRVHKAERFEAERAPKAAGELFQ